MIRHELPTLLVTTSAPDLEKSIENGGALSGRVNAASGTNHLVRQLSKGLPIEHAHTAKAFGPPPTKVKPPKEDDTPQQAAPASDDRTDDQKARQNNADTDKSVSLALDDLIKGGEGSGPQGNGFASVSKPKDTFKEAEDMVRKQRADRVTSVFAAKKPRPTPSSGMSGMSKSCGSLKPDATDTDVKPKRRRDVVEKGVVFVIDPSQDKKDPLLTNTHGEEFHTDADKETVDFITRTGAVNSNDPVHNPPVTPELNGFPLAIPTFYCSLSPGDLLKAEEEKSLMQKAFNW